MFQVSWIRTRDIRVLSIGRIRYTQDTRFTPLHEEGNDVWALKIQETRMSDSGLYECQVSYHDDVEKKLKKPVKLLVLGKRHLTQLLTRPGPTLTLHPISAAQKLHQ